MQVRVLHPPPVIFFMQIIDLRKKQTPVLTPPPAPKPEPEKISVEPEIETEAGVVSWHTMLSRTISRYASWCAALTLFAAAAAIIYFKGDILFASALGLAGAVLVLRAYAPAGGPSRINVDRTGISIDGQKYFYHEVGSFWLDYQPPHTKELSIQFRKFHHAPLRIPLRDANPLEIRALMIQFIPEKEHERSLLDQLISRIGQ